ncbi:MAG: TolC family outer membrane protein [Endozoicomonas sp.]
MPRNHRKGFLLTVLAGAVFSVQAAENEYNLLEVYKLAQKNDAQIAAARADMQATQEGATQSRAGLLPNLSLSAGTQRQDTTSDVKNGSDIKADGAVNSWGARLTQPVFRMDRWYGYDQSKSISKQAESKFGYEQQNLILRVSEAYFNVLRAEDSLISAEAEEKAVKQQLDQARERYNVGLIAETDVLEAQAAYDNARVARILGENQLSVSYEALRTITNEDIRNIGKLKKSMPLQQPAPANSDEWVNKAINNNLSLQAAREGVVAAETSIKVNKSGHAPTVDAFASYDWNDNELNKALPQADGSYRTGKGSNTAFGLQFSMELFGGGATSSKVRQATYQFESAQKKFDNELRTTNSKTRNLFRTVNSDVERVQARCQGIISSESALKATRSGYEVGTRNITDVLDAQKVLFGSQRDYLNARYDFIVNTLKLKQTSGILSPQDLGDLNQWIISSEEMSIPEECRAS